jgi:sugar phosphate isomerase/epimerase
MADKKQFKVGVSFHSFTDAYCSFKWSFEDMMQLASHLGGGVEIVGPAHQRGFPILTDEFERIFKSSVDRYGLTPTSYGSYADPFMLKDRDLSEDELVEYTIPQMESTKRLGFEVVRLQYFTHKVIERILPHAERLKIKVAYELHVPLMIESAETQMLLKQIKQLSSPWLGLIPDTGIFAHSIPAYRLEIAKQDGVSDEIIARAVEMWNARVPLHDALPEFDRLGLRAENLTTLELIWGSYGQSEPAALKEVLPYTFHIHGKFFSMENGVEPNLRFEEVVKVLVEEGYDGWISSEYEGKGGVDTFDLVRQQQAMIETFRTHWTNASGS